MTIKTISRRALAPGSPDNRQPTTDNAAKRLRAPFPYFGGKSRVAEIVWSHFGDVKNYVEPFCGSMAMLLGRPHWPFEAPRVETVNDADCFIANFWRSLQADPEAVAAHCDWPVNEADLHARHLWLVSRGREHVEKLRTDPDYYHAQIAGWWVWGISQWIGSGWCSGMSSWGQPFADGRLAHERLPQLGSGNGVHRTSQQIPQLGSGNGVHRTPQKIRRVGHGTGVQRSSYQRTADLLAELQGLADRLRKVRVCCGDWARVTTPTPTTYHGLTGVFLDPPYGAAAKRDATLYSVDSLTVSDDVREWSLAHGDDPLFRIALCGYEGEHKMPKRWRCIAWKASGGMANIRKGRIPGNPENAHRERIWLSPHCL